MNRIQNDILNTIKNDDGILLIDLLNKLKNKERYYVKNV